MPGAEATWDSRARAMELGLRSRKQRIQPEENTGRVQSRAFEVRDSDRKLLPTDMIRAMQKADRRSIRARGMTVSQMQNADRAKKNLKPPTKDVKDIASTGLKEFSKGPLTTALGSVWLDWTLLSLLYLNIHMCASLLLPKYICQLGEDYLIGKWLPDRTFAKIFEIILIVLLDVFVLTIIGAVLYGIYFLIFELDWKDYIAIGWEGTKAIIPGGETPFEAGAGEAASRILD